MNWLIFALAAPIIYTIVNFTDKYVIEREVPDTRSVPIFLAIVQGTVGAILWLVNGRITYPLDITLLIMATGASIVIGTFLLFRALIREETSRIVLWTQLVPVVILVLSVLILDEVLTIPQFVGFVLILSATVGLSLKREAGVLSFSRTFFYVLGAVITWSVSDILMKWIIVNNPQLEAIQGDTVNVSVFVSITTYQALGFAFGGLCFYLAVPPVRHAFNHRLRHTRRLALGVLFANESIFILRQFVKTMALALGPIALVSVLDSTRIFLGIAVGWVLTQIAPTIFRETTTREGLMQKLIFASVLFAGLIFIFAFGTGGG